jgi:predicted nucleic acid-binding protein
VIYLDTSVAVAHLLGETRVPPASIWTERLVASRLLEYELWVRIHARRLTRTHADAVRGLLATIALVEMAPLVLARATEPFPVPVRTLDAIHLASMLYLHERGESVTLASYDDRLGAAARAVGIALAAI